MAKVTNGTGRPVTANIRGEWFHVAPGKSVTVDDPRVALSLGEYGLTVADRDRVVEAEPVPVTAGETRHTGGRQHDIDDPRANPPGTPVTETGDTGSTIPAPGVQGVTAEAAAEGEPNRVQGVGEEAERVAAEAAARDAAARGVTPVEDLKGAELDEALETAGLTKSGTADEKRARLAEHRATAGA